MPNWSKRDERVMAAVRFRCEFLDEHGLPLVRDLNDCGERLYEVYTCKVCGRLLDTRTYNRIEKRRQCRAKPFTSPSTHPHTAV